jgi:hypothetical protein
MKCNGLYSWKVILDDNDRLHLKTPREMRRS